MNPKLQELAGYIKAHPMESMGDIYHPLPFPEFQQLTVSSDPGATNKKWSLIKQSLPDLSFNELKVLDVGANIGFYTFSLAQLGAAVDAYEPRESYVQLGRQIVDVTGLTVNWHPKTLETEDINTGPYDIALMLSVFQWISDGDTRLQYAGDILRAVASSSRILFFELGCNYGRSAIHTHERPIGWIWRLLQQQTSPRNVVYLGSAVPWKDGRRYMFACTDVPLRLTAWQRFVTFALKNRWIQ